MSDSPKLTIGDLAKAIGTKVVTIRYYEQIGLRQPRPARQGDSGHTGPTTLAG